MTVIIWGPNIKVEALSVVERSSGERPRRMTPGQSWCWFFLLLFAAIEVLRSISDLSVLFDDYAVSPGTSPGGLVVTASRIVCPVLAATAFVFALRSRLDRAIMALAAVALVRWASDLPIAFRAWPDLDFPLFEGTLRLLVLPALAVAAIALARRETRLGLATFFAILPTLVDVAAVAAFIVSVSLYGF